jgi:ribonuclease BN (tRNA processing enzyme)
MQHGKRLATGLMAASVLLGLAGVARADDAPLPAAAHTRLVLLGTQGGPRPAAQRAEPANLLVVNGVNYLVDAGNGVALQLAKVGVAPAQIRDIFITHNHDDHNADWGTLMGLAWSVSSDQPITVYGPAGTEMMRRGFLQYFAPNVAARHLEGEQQNMPVEKFMLAHDYPGPGPVFRDGNIRVTAAENCHFHFPPGTPGFGWQHSYALRFETPDRVIVFSGDTGPCGEVIPSIAKGADILVHEVIDLEAIGAQIQREVQGGQVTAAQAAGLMNHMRTEHTPPEEVGRVAQAAGVKLLVLSHLVIGNDPAAEQKLLAAVHQTFSGPVIVGHDLQAF